MLPDEPPWWYGDGEGPWPRLLAPVSRLYGRLAERRLHSHAPYRSRLPVLCVGNFTAGGTGKTSLSMHIAELLTAMGERPVILTRGYGGRVTGPHWVDAEADNSDLVGDEPLLLVRAAPTLIAADRRAGAIAIETAARDVSVIVMDDGLQNPTLAKDLAIAIIDEARGIGNGRVIPSGPLRAPLDVQLPITDAILVCRPPAEAASTPSERDAPVASHSVRSIIEDLRRNFPGPVIAARTEAADDLEWLTGTPVVAYAGIANPARFFALVEAAGGDIVVRRTFRDHHPYTDAEAKSLVDRAAAIPGARLVTTQKDFVRLTGRGGPRAALAAASSTIPIRLVFDANDATRLTDMIASALATGGYRGRFPLE